MQAKQRMCHAANARITPFREITTVLKTAVDNAILELCDYLSDVVSTVINESSSTTLECALRS